MVLNGPGRKCMNDKCFLDTNVLIYAYDETDELRQQQTLKILKNIKREYEPVISTQTLGEFFNVAYKKLHFSKEDAINVCQEFSNFYPVYEISTENVFHAMKISKQTQYSYWDSLILAMAIDTGCSILFSEDLNPGHEIEGLKIINPFSRGN